MEKETTIKKTLGQSIDEIIRALEPLDEASRLTAVRAVCEHLKITISTQTIEVSKPEEPKIIEQPFTPSLIDIKTLKEEKKPSSAIEMAALIAYYLSELAPERKQFVEPADMEKYFKQAGFPLPRAPEVILPNAKNAGYFEVVERGKYKLNPVGYNLVVHKLPHRKPSAPSIPARRKKELSKRRKSVED